MKYLAWSFRATLKNQKTNVFACLLTYLLFKWRLNNMKCFSSVFAKQTNVHIWRRKRSWGHRKRWFFFLLWTKQISCTSGQRGSRGDHITSAGDKKKTIPTWGKTLINIVTFMFEKKKKNLLQFVPLPLTFRVHFLELSA